MCSDGRRGAVPSWAQIQGATLRCPTVAPQFFVPSSAGFRRFFGEIFCVEIFGLGFNVHVLLFMKL